MIWLYQCKLNLPKGFFYSQWTLSSKRKRHHFLTHHAHTQRPLHSYGISSGLSLFSSFFHFSRDTHLFLFIFVGFVQLDDSLFVGIEIVYSVGLSLFSTFTVTVFDANQCPSSLINHGFVLYFAHLGFVEIVLLLDIAYYMYDFLVIHVSTIKEDKIELQRNMIPSEKQP